MSITRKELEELLKIKTSFEKIVTLSSDGRNLLLRIPKEIREYLSLEKGDKARFSIGDNEKIGFEIIKDDKGKKEKRD